MSVSDNTHEEAIEAAAIKRFPDTVWSQSAAILSFREAFKDGFQAGLLTASKGETPELWRNKNAGTIYADVDWSTEETGYVYVTTDKGAKFLVRTRYLEAVTEHQGQS